jgi:hypothetical protein
MTQRARVRDCWSPFGDGDILDRARCSTARLAVISSTRADIRSLLLDPLQLLPVEQTGYPAALVRDRAENLPFGTLFVGVLMPLGGQHDGDRLRVERLPSARGTDPHQAV